MCSIWLGVVTAATAQPVHSLEGKSISLGRVLRDSPSTSNLPRVSQIEHPFTSARMLVQSPAPTKPPSVPPNLRGKQEGEVVQVTAVRVNPTDTGVEVILQTTQGEALQPIAIALGKTYIANIPNTVLALTQRGFRQDNPATGITRVAVTQATLGSIRVTVTGEAGVPTVELYDSPEEGLIFGVARAASTPPQGQQPPSTQPTPQPVGPGSETQPGSPAAEGEEEINIVVTGEEPERYNVLKHLFLIHLHRFKSSLSKC